MKLSYGHSLDIYAVSSLARQKDGAGALLASTQGSALVFRPGRRKGGDRPRRLVSVEANLTVMELSFQSAS